MTRWEMEDWIDRWKVRDSSVCGACTNNLKRTVRASHDMTIRQLYDTDKAELIMLAGEVANAPWALIAERAEDELGW